MPTTSQKFQFGSAKRELDLVSSKVPHEPPFIYVDDVLEAFKISGADRFEVDGRTIAYVRHDNGIITPGTMSSHKSINQLGIKSNVLTDLDSSEPISTILPRRTTTHIHSQLNTLITAVEQASHSGSPLNAKAMQDLIGKHLLPCTNPEDSQQYLMQNVGTLVRDMGELKLQGEVIEQLARKMIDMQQQALDRLTLIQSKTEAILTQQLELAEYPIPRLFIVLPEEPAKYDAGNWFRTKFRLHFICECGKHTEAHNNKIQHHLHLAKHEGYLVREPTEFFQKYGPFLLLMLELIKFGTSVAGHVVPTLASLKVVELSDSVKQSVEQVAAKIDISLECIDKQLTKVQASSTGDFTSTEPRAAMTQQDLANYLSDVEGLEGVELRQLGSFLKTSEEDNLLGNLYRMTTSDGHVKWVCLDHYRASYQETQTQKLRDVVKLAQGEFDEQLGRITITLKSSFAATEFYDAVRKAKGVLELIVDLSWECTSSDLEALEVALKSSRISILCLDLRQFRTSLGSKLLSTTMHYDVLFRIRELPTMKLIHVLLPKAFVKLPSMQPKTPKTPPHLCKFSYELTTGSVGGKEFGRLAETLKTNSTLTTLNLKGSSIGDNGAQALAEALKTNSTLTTLNLEGNSIDDNGAQALAETLKTNSTLTTLNLEHNSIGDNGARALAEALNTTRCDIKLWGQYYYHASDGK
ncbi:hypothetical protein BG006_000186 [Podila minutissima]|uniref:RNI-like protein n=1 Tax=Podila minutissima TaxID=64525 RepID=A0A9P5STX3_9FUNG|nr:hypothetical protein BG006_000186 [Podila minutissima]